MVHYFFSFLFFFFCFIGFYGLKWGLLGPAVNIFASQLLIYLVEMFVACLCLLGQLKDALASLVGDIVLGKI